LATVEELYRRHGPMVLRRCQRLLKDPEKAVDAMHDVFVEVLRREGSLEVEHPSALLFRTATNVCLNRLRAQRRRPGDEAPKAGAAEDDLLLRIASLEEPGGRSEARSILGRLFSREQPSTRHIAVLHLLDGMTLEEVAAESGLSVSGVRKRLRVLQERLFALEGASEAAHV
jgi:RNA polymerase sigma factor (sigma-70 family)